MPVYWIRSAGRDALRAIESIEHALAVRDTGHPRLQAALEQLHARWSAELPETSSFLGRLRQVFRRDALLDEFGRVSDFQHVVVEILEALAAENAGLRRRLAAIEEGPEPPDAPASEALPSTPDALERESVERHTEPAYWRARAQALDDELGAARERLVLLAGILPTELLDLLDADLARLRREAGGHLDIETLDGSFHTRPADVESEMRLLWARLGKGGRR